MSTKLIIVESPAKIRTIKKILGESYDVDASYGHIRDLDKESFRGFGIDINNGYQPVYKIIEEKSGKKSKKEIVRNLQNKAKGASEVLLASDPDREGEAIAWHLSQVLKHKNIKRITFNAITKSAVTEAIKHPRDIDLDLFYSQQARRILDRLVGFTLSPVLWSQIARGLSVGRVQSPALVLIADREKEVIAFKPEEYWDIFAHVITHKKDNYILKLEKISGKKKRVSNNDEALKTCNQIEKTWNKGDVKVNKNKVKRSPQPPFITSTLQRAGNTILGWTAEKTMMVAQGLYENGHITYMRTDSVRMSDEAIIAIGGYVKNKFGKEYYQHRVFSTKKEAQDAHEAIRPTHIDVLSVDDNDANALYSLIWARSVASQMADAILNETSVVASIDVFELCAKGFIVEFDGFSKVWKLGDTESLPEVKDGIKNNILKTTEKEQKFTKAPPRYSEARLIEVLEKEGVGRPSTYAAIVEVLLKRNYVVREGRGKSAVLKATDLGIQVSDFLKKNLEKYVSMGFTAGMEMDLDSIENGKAKWNEVLDKYYPALKSEADKIRKTRELVGKKCPKCKMELVYRPGKQGRFVGCSGYPQCDYSEGDNRSQSTKLDEKCPKCGRNLAVRNGKYGEFIGCTGYPKCKYIKKQESGKKCPECGKDLMHIFSKKTKKKFWGCSGYPECKYTGR